MSEQTNCKRRYARMYPVGATFVEYNPAIGWHMTYSLKSPVITKSIFELPQARKVRNSFISSWTASTAAAQCFFPSRKIGKIGIRSPSNA